MQDFVDNWMARPLDDDKPKSSDELEEERYDRAMEALESKEDVVRGEEALGMSVIELAEFVKNCTAEQAVSYTEDVLEFLRDQGEDTDYAEYLLKKAKIVYVDNAAKKSAIFSVLDTFPCVKAFSEATGGTCLEDIAAFTDSDASEIESLID